MGKKAEAEALLRREQTALLQKQIDGLTQQLSAYQKEKAKDKTKDAGPIRDRSLAKVRNAGRDNSRDTDQVDLWESTIGYERQLHVEQSFDFRFSRHPPIGFISALTLGTEPLKPDLPVINPTLLQGGGAANTSQAGRQGIVYAVGPLTAVSWELGDTDPITFQARVSADSKEKLTALRYATTPVIDVTLSWMVFEFDEVRRSYYASFSNANSDTSPATPVRGQLEKRGRRLELRIGSGPADDIEVPQNFTVQFSIVPKDDSPQNIYLAAGYLRKVQKTWGRSKNPSTPSGSPTGGS